MLDISAEQSALQIKFLKALDLFCIFKFIITNDVKIHERETYELLTSILNSYSLISVNSPSREVFSEAEKIYQKYFCSTGEETSTSASAGCEAELVPDSEQAQRNGPTALNGSTYEEVGSAQKRTSSSQKRTINLGEIFTNDSLFSKHLSNKQIFQFFKFPKSKKVGDYVNKCCVHELINEPLNINVGFVKFDKKKRRKKKRKRPKKGTINIPTNLCKYSSDSGIHNSRMKNSCSCFHESKENSKFFSNDFKKVANEADLSVSDSSELFPNLRSSFVRTPATSYFGLNTPNCSNSEDESDYNYYSENTNREDAGKGPHKTRNVKLRNQYLSVKLSLYNSRLCNSGGRAAPGGAAESGAANHANHANHANCDSQASSTNGAPRANHFYDETSMCFNHFHEIHNILNRDPNGLRKIKIMLKKDIGTISISPFYINFDCTRIFKNVCRAFNFTNFDYKNQGVYQIINSCFSTAQSGQILKYIFLDDLYEQQEIFESEMNGKKNARKKNLFKMRNKEHVLEMLDDEKRINVLYFINRFLYSQKTPLSNLFASHCLESAGMRGEDGRSERLKRSSESARSLPQPPPVQPSPACEPDDDPLFDDPLFDDPPFDELTIDYLLFLMVFEKKIDHTFRKYLMRKIDSCRGYLPEEGQEKTSLDATYHSAATASSFDSQPNWSASHHKVRKIERSSFHLHGQVEKKQVNDTDSSDATQSRLEEFKRGETPNGRVGVSPVVHDGDIRGGDKTEAALPNGEITSIGSFTSLTSFTSLATQATLTAQDSITTQDGISTGATISASGTTCRQAAPPSDKAYSTCSMSSVTPSGISITNTHATNETQDEAGSAPPPNLADIQSKWNEWQNKTQLVKKTNEEMSDCTKSTTTDGYEEVENGVQSVVENGTQNGIQNGIQKDEQNHCERLEKTDPPSDAEPKYKSKAKYKSEIQNEITLLKCIRPFPTVYWLINKNMCGYISHLEKMNIIKNIEYFVNCKKEEFRLLRYYLIYDHLKYITIRLRHINKRIFRFFYNLFLNSHNFKKQFSSDESSQCISSIYTNSFDFSPHVLTEFMRTYQIDSQVITEILRKINTLRVKGIGGISNFLTVKCIHLYFASHLSYPNTIGYILEEFFKS
ncbi:rhoptry protein RHOP148, putative [Plasmodium vivax]|uniref:Rhoptry protein RHOP148, putative n=1 Tax=Plasmodium vivax TaxID=5855 RepID=A0A1G4HET7_PLAVI|nr:rhoptry protein RHOP148, putative [Plasmodium vivax]